MKRIAREALNMGLIGLGILSAGLGLKGFLLSSRFIDGGVTGVSMLLADVLGWPLSILILVINLPFIALGLSPDRQGFCHQEYAGHCWSFSLSGFPQIS